MMTFVSAEAISVRPFSHVTMLGTKHVKGGAGFERETGFKEVPSGEGGGRGAGGGGGGGAEWRRECLQLPGAEAERRRERKKKSSSHCAAVDVRATGCDRLADRSLSHTRRHSEKLPITQIKCQADKREPTGRVKTCGFIYAHKTDFLTLSAGGEKSSPLLFFAAGDYLGG